MIDEATKKAIAERKFKLFRNGWARQGEHRDSADGAISTAIYRIGHRWEDFCEAALRCSYQIRRGNEASAALYRPQMQYEAAALIEAFTDLARGKQ